MSKTFSKSVIGFCLIFIFSSIALTQTMPSSGATPEMRIEANDFYQKQDWLNALKAYGKILKLDSSNVGARYRYGVALLNLNKNAEAKAELENVFAASPNAIFALSLARVYSRLNEKEKMFETLEKSTTLGGIAPETLTGEKDFMAFKNDARFLDLVKKSDLAVNPCKASPEFRQFDFWIGEWDAKNAQGVTVGSSSIQQILNQCVIFENWTTPLQSGKSFSIFNAADKKWHQAWVDDKGTFTNYVGELKDGNLIFLTENVANGKKTLARMTFSKLPNGDVRQFGENSTDDGKTWMTSFDFTYSRKK